MDKDAIVNIVCEVTNISREEMFGKSRLRKYTHPRMLAYLLIQDFSKVSSTFQSFYWKLERSTISAGIKRADQLFETSEQMRDWYTRCINIIAASKRKVA